MKSRSEVLKFENRANPNLLSVINRVLRSGLHPGLGQQNATNAGNPDRDHQSADAFGDPSETVAIHHHFLEQAHRDHYRVEFSPIAGQELKFENPLPIKNVRRSEVHSVGELASSIEQLRIGNHAGVIRPN